MNHSSSLAGFFSTSRLRFKAVSAFGVLALASLHASASNVADFYAFGVQGSSLYAFSNPTTRIAVTNSLTVSPDSYASNHLAADVDRNRMIYGLSDITGNGTNHTVQGIYAWNFSTGTRTLLSGNVDIANTVGNSWGGGAMYKGDYYLFDDESGQQGIVKMTFDANGLINNISKPYGSSSVLGELGDIAITSGGMMYVLTNTSYKLCQKDLNVAGTTFTEIGNYGSLALNGQLLLDSQGRLLSAGSSDGKWYQLDTSGAGKVISTFAGASNAIAFDDMAAVGPMAAAVPEPETYAMMLAGLMAMGSVSRRRRPQR